MLEQYLLIDLLPDDVFKYHLMQYLTIRDVALLDSACMNHKYRNKWLDQLMNVILIGDMTTELDFDILYWLHRKTLY